jgi:hypothetical protein
MLQNQRTFPRSEFETLNLKSLSESSRGLLDGHWRQGPLEALLFLGTEPGIL